MSRRITAKGAKASAITAMARYICTMNRTDRIYCTASRMSGHSSQDGKGGGHCRRPCNDATASKGHKQRRKPASALKPQFACGVWPESVGKPSIDAMPSAVPMNGAQRGATSHAPHEGACDEPVARADQTQDADNLRARCQRRTGRERDDRAGYSGSMPGPSADTTRKRVAALDQRSAPLCVIVIDCAGRLCAQTQAQPLPVRPVGSFRTSIMRGRGSASSGRSGPKPADSSSPCSCGVMHARVRDTGCRAQHFQHRVALRLHSAGGADIRTVALWPSACAQLSASRAADIDSANANTARNAMAPAPSQTSQAPCPLRGTIRSESMRSQL